MATAVPGYTTTTVNITRQHSFGAQISHFFIYLKKKTGNEMPFAKKEALFGPNNYSSMFHRISIKLGGGDAVRPAVGVLINPTL